MSNTYAINTTRGKEFAVSDELKALGLNPWVPTILASKYVKEKRSYSWYDKPYVGKLIFCVIPAIMWPDVAALKHVIGKPLALSQRDIDGTPAHFNTASRLDVPAVPGLRTFKAAVAAEYADRARQRANSEYECQYAPGDALKMLSGPWEGFTAEFSGVIKRAHEGYAKLRVEIDMFGRSTPVEVDPDKVAAVAT